MGEADTIGIDLTGKTAIVTGAGQGLGREIGLRLAEAGAVVYFADYDAEKSHKACEEGPG
ncbi:MAG: SDR family NAD(P)-dependent oxidoreductase [Lachnospiraceae bacterium]|nr:SDR family NAD(P)-dependent oxidoreductase [Lachnospiraceae bacterium]